jgi:hypothetical protein
LIVIPKRRRPYVKTRRRAFSLAASRSSDCITRKIPPPIVATLLVLITITTQCKPLLASEVPRATAKLQGEHDSLPEYMTQLRKPGVVDGPKIDNDISKVAWVEATLFESELKGYYTKYLATVWDGIAILVTFSVHKDSYAQFQSLILPCIRSLELKSDWKKK